MIESIMKVIQINKSMGTKIIFTMIVVVILPYVHTFAFSPIIPLSRNGSSSSLNLHTCAFCKFGRKEYVYQNRLHFEHHNHFEQRRISKRWWESINHYTHNKDYKTYTPSSQLMMQKNPLSNQNNKGLLQILNDEVSDLLLEKLSQKLNGNNIIHSDSNGMATPKNKSNSRFQPSPTLLSSKTTDGLSKFHRSILATTTKRQRCVTGKYPLHITITENPTRKWLSSSSSSSTPSSSSPSSRIGNSFLNHKLSLKSTAGTSQMLVNGTSVDKSLASFDRYQWLDEDEQQTLHQEHTLMSIELVAEIHVKKPGYVNILSASAAGYMAEQEAMNPFWSYENNNNDNNNNKNDGNDMHNNRNTGSRIYSNEYESSQIIQSEALKQYLQQQQQKHKERMWITGFSLTKQPGELHYIDIENGRMGSVNERSASSIRWPNEVNYVPKPKYASNNLNPDDYIDDNFNEQNGANSYEDALLVSDGFLVPGKDNGGLYVTLNPGHEALEWNVCLAGGNGVDRLLTKLENRKQQKNVNSSQKYSNPSASTTTSQVADDEDGWFYHRAVWVDLTNDGRQSILTARAKRPSILKKTDKNGSIYSSSDDNLSSQSQSMPTKAQLVWLERPKPDRYDEVTGTPLDKDGLVFNPFEPKHTPWKLRVLDEGPDVMFSIADMDTTDDTIEVFASQFFNKKVTLHSIKRGNEPRIVWKRDIDDRCGASFSSILATLDRSHGSTTRKVIDCGSTIPTLEQGDDFSHLLVTSHECKFAEEDNQNELQDQINRNRRSTDDIKDSKCDENSSSIKSTTIDGGSLFAYRVPEGKDGWRTKPWVRSVISTGFRVKGQLGNFINPGAPGFCYTFYPTKHGMKETGDLFLSRPLIAIAGDCAESAYILRPVNDNRGDDPSANYAMMCEIECGATVGSIGVGYEDFCFAPQQSGYAKIYVPCYEKDKVLVFALGNGEDEDANDHDGW